MEKLLAIISLGQNLYGKWLLQKLIVRIVVIFTLVLLAVVMVAAILVGLFYAGYLELLQYGETPQMAFIIAGGGFIALTLLLILIIMGSIARLRGAPFRLLRKKLPSSVQVNEVFDSFLAGLMGTPDKGTD